MKFFEKNWISKIFFFNFRRKKNFDREFFEKFFLQPPNFFSENDFKHQKWKLHEDLTVLTPFRTLWQAVKVTSSRFHPPPPTWPD